MPIQETYVELIKDIDWDTLDVRSGESYLGSKLFTVPIGEKKTFLKTSMRECGRLPAPQYKNIRKLQVLWNDNNAIEDNRSFRQNSRYTLWIGTKSYDYGPFARFQSFTSSTDLEQLLEQVKIAKSIGFNVAGNYVEYSVDNSPIGLMILQGQHFCFEISVDKEWKPEKDFQIIVCLDGIKSRGI